MDDALLKTLAENLVRVREQIHAAALAVGRSGDDIRLVAVTKYVSVPLIRALASLGCCDLGESRPQALWAKAEALADLTHIRWHMIGPMQRNKLAKTLPITHLFHSADSERLLQSLDEEAARVGKPASALIEVNISQEPSKHGFAIEQVEPLLEKLGAYPNVRIHGLMGMSSREGDSAAARREFASLRELRDRLMPLAPPNVPLKELSMGMSGDFQEAIGEGATMLRIGSALFEGIAHD